MTAVLTLPPGHPGAVAVGGRRGRVRFEAEVRGRLGDAIDEEVLVLVIAVLAHDGAELGQLAVQHARHRIPLVHHDLVQPVGKQRDVGRERQGRARDVRGLIWVDMVWPWVIAYDLWNHAFLYNSLADYTWYCTLALLLACTIPAFTWAKGQWIWFRCFTLVFWISMNTLLPEVLVPPSDIFNFATMDPRANIACAVAALAANVALFAYWLYKIVAFKRNPITGVLYCELAEFRTIVREHCDDKDKYFLVDRIPETPAELGFEPDSPTPPADGYRAWMPWWRGSDSDII